MDEYATGRLHLERLIKQERDEPRNEATTRLHLIDPILMDCLRWQPEDIKSEDHIDGQRADYLVGRPSARVVVEAKKEGISFTLPAGVTSRVVNISTLLEDAPTKAAIEQVLRYCQDRSVPIAVATNGHQLIAFLASRQDAVRALAGRALVFRSLQDMYDDFRTLWDSLSPEGIVQATLQRALGSAEIGLAPPQKLSTRSPNYPGFRHRSELETDLKILGQLFLLDITGEREVSDAFLRDCYAASGALSQYALVSKEILRTRYALVEAELSDVEPVQGRKGITPKLNAAVLSSALSRRPVLLLGDVGVGKTIFIRHLLRIDARDVLEDAIVLYLDFGSEPAVAEDLPNYVANRLVEQLREDHGVDVFDRRLVKAVYNAELNRFQRSVAGALKDTDPPAYAQRELAMLERLLDDRGEHVRRTLEHVRGTTGRGVVVVLDNVDQRPTSFQEEVFLIGEGIASRWPSTVFIALRPSTFHESRLRGSLSGYHSRSFTVYPARTDEVISRRLKFARDQLVETGRLESFPEGLSLDSSSLLAYLDVLIKAFDFDDALKEMLDNLSGGNVRVALDFVNAFVGSGYVSTQRILDVAERGDIYTIPLHEFFRAIAYGDAEQYDPAQSPIINVLDITSADGREHFLLPSLIVEADLLGKSRGTAAYIEVDLLHERGAAWGFSQEQVGAQLARAFQTRLLEGDTSGETSGSCRATSVGVYTVLRLLTMFTYLDAIVVDLPIVDPEVRSAVTEAWPIAARVDRARIVHKYLDEQWAHCAEAGLTLDWPALSTALGASINDAEVRARRAEEKRQMDSW
jgi:hypothetical protein